MCGRFALNRALGQLQRTVNARRINTHGRQFTPSNNIAPSDAAPVVSSDNIDILQWGINRGGKFIINARSETVQSFFNQEKRGAVPADGYFEWDHSKQPFMFRVDGRDLLLLAAVFTDQGEFAIVTRAAIDTVSKVHDRMPLILSLDQMALWQTPNWPVLLKEEVPTILFHPVNRLALKTGYSGPDTVQPIVKAQTSPAQKTLEQIIQQATAKKMKKIIEE